MASSPKQTVSVRLEVANDGDSGESHITRYITLEAPSYSVRIGRGSRSGSKDLYPADNNAWFDSRVMSREHAVLKANIVNKTLTIEDVGSMHGTYVDDVKLSKWVPKFVHDGAQIIFGAEVSRGPDTFPALEIDIFYNFDTSTRGEYVGDLAPLRPSRNSFSVPDYDSEEDYSSEMEARILSPRGARVDSNVSDDENSLYKGWNRPQNHLEATQKASEELNKQTKTSPADVIMWSSCPSKENASQSVPEKETSSEQANMQPIISAPSIARPVASVIGRAAMSTDELSESDYGDDISASLFDEEYDTDPYYQRSEPQQEASSFSSQSPILTSLPSKIELAECQPTLQEATKANLPNPPLLATSAPRAPSPSDAAMPKAKVPIPTEYGKPGSTLKKPFSKYSYGHSYGQPINSPDSSFTRPYGGYSYASYGSYGDPSAPDFQGVQDTYPQPYCNLPTYPYLETPAVDWSWGAQMPIKPLIPAAKAPGPEQAPISTPASPFVTIKTTPRVTIQDLVDKPQIHEESSHDRNSHAKANGYADMCFINPPGTKRKADQISEGDPAVQVLDSLEEADVAASVSQDIQDAQIVKPFAPTTSSQSQTDLVDLPAAIVANVQENTDERPKKKARSSLYTLAAATAGGIAIGAVGTVAALVALPPDFFV